jgi:hypothetical protein
MFAALASQPVAGEEAAPTGGGAWRDYVGVRVESDEPDEGHKELLVRSAAATDDRLPTSMVTKLLSSESGSFFGKATARVVIGANDRLAECKTEKATIRRGFGKAQRPEAPLAIDVCPLLRTSAHFRHAIDVNGQPLASTAKVSVFFSHTDVPPIPVMAFRSRTSGHVLSETGAWVDSPFWANLTPPNVLELATPDWSAALADLHDIPEGARVGVKLKLTASMGIGSVDSCKVVLSSGNARFDAAACKALLATRYSEYRGYAGNGTHDDDDAYPVLVKWSGKTAEMASPALPNVPHLPKDVLLTAADKPSGTPPELQIIPMRIFLDGDGRPTGCRVMHSSGDDKWDAAGCRIALQRAHFTAPSDGFGRPAKGLYEAVADWTTMTIHPARK